MSEPWGGARSPAIDHELRERKTGAGRGMGAAGRWGEPGAVSDRESVLRNGQADPEWAAGARSGDPLTFLCGRKRAGICRAMDLTETQYGLVESRAKARFVALCRRRMGEAS